MSQTEPEILTIPELARKFREMAELTAKASKNWDNYEQICLDVLRQLEASLQSLDWRPRSEEPEVYTEAIVCLATSDPTDEPEYEIAKWQPGKYWYGDGRRIELVDRWALIPHPNR